MYNYIYTHILCTRSKPGLSGLALQGIYSFAALGLKIKGRSPVKK